MRAFHQSHLLAQEEFITRAGFIEELGKTSEKENKIQLSLLLRSWFSNFCSSSASWDITWLWLALPGAGCSVPLRDRLYSLPARASPSSHSPLTFPFPSGPPAGSSLASSRLAEFFIQQKMSSAHGSPLPVAALRIVPNRGEPTAHCHPRAPAGGT